MFGLAVTLGTASVLNQMALRQRLPMPPPTVAPMPDPTIRPKPSEPMRSVVIASRRHRDNY